MSKHACKNEKRYTWQCLCKGTDWVHVLEHTCVCAEWVHMCLRKHEHIEWVVFVSVCA